jgi:hypothetical protein
MISKKFTFLNVGNQATFLGNIKNSIDAANIGAEYGWTIDDYVSGDDGLIMAHSHGAYGNQNLFYSIKLRNPNSGTSHIHLCGQTGYDSGLGYAAQPGRFTVETRGLVGSWNGVADNGSLGNYLKTPTTKQIIFVNKQNIHVFWEGEISTYGQAIVYPVWWRFTIGAMDSFFPETETILNYVDETIWSSRGWASCNFMGGWGYYPWPYSTSSWGSTNYPITGLLFKQPFDSVPVNKDFHTTDSWQGNLRSTPRWYSTVHFLDSYNYGYYQSNPPTYHYGSWDYTSWRLGTNYTRGLNYNTSFVKHFMHKPVVILYEWLDASNIFHYPIAYLPYQALRMGNLLKGDDTVSYGTRNFAVFPTFKNGNDFGMAIEFIEG